jgi:hypothetical protein
MASDSEILENVEQLMEMGLEGHALLEQLMSIGFSRREAREWVERASKKKEKTSKKETLSETEKEKKEDKEKPKEKAGPDAMEKLFQKGILATVDAKLEKMEKLKKDIDNVVESKVGRQYSVLEKKMETLFEAQRELTMLKIESQLAAKVKEIDSSLDGKIAEIRKLNLAATEDLQKTNAQKMAVSDLMNQVGDKLEGLEAVRKQLSAGAQEKLEELQEEVDGLIFRTEERLEEAENKAAQTLQLEEKITAGLAEQVENQANTILEKRVKDLRMELKEEVMRAKQLSADLSAEKMQDSIAEVKEAINNLEGSKQTTLGDIEKSKQALMEEIEKSKQALLTELEDRVASRADAIFDKKQKELGKKIEELVGDMVLGKKNLGDKMVEIESTMQNLEMFKEQFLEALKKSRTEREDVARVFNTKLKSFNIKADSKINEMDTKIHQIDSITKELARVISELNASRKQPLQPFPDPSIPAEKMKEEKKHSKDKK